MKGTNTIYQTFVPSLQTLICVFYPALGEASWVRFIYAHCNN